MNKLNGFDYFEVPFNKDGAIVDRSQLDQLLGAIATYTDLFVMSHGWNNDEAEARNLYERLSKQIADALPRFPLPGRTFAILAIFWPSKRFADEELIPGGAASASQDAVLLSKVTRLKEAIAAKPSGSSEDPNAQSAAVKLDAAIQHIPNLDGSADARAAFVNAIRSAFAGEAPADQNDDASNRLFTASPDDLLKRLADGDDDFWDEAPPSGSVAASFNPSGFRPWTPGGGAASLQNPITSFKNGARNLLNLFTYFTMKERAGAIGKNGVAQMLDELLARKQELKLHLIGHSFGGRLVTASADAVKKQGGSVAPGPIQTMALLQAAYSHNGLSPNFDTKGTKGFFNGVVANEKVRGPIVISHTRNDRAVGIAYPLASRLNGDIASGLGDANDPHGGMGSNGAQKSNADTSVPLAAGQQLFQFQAARIYNMRADSVITGHSDIAKAEVAAAILSAVSTP